VKEHEGWTSKRREATKEEIKKLGVYNRGKSYFVDVVYQVHDPSKKKKQQSKKKKAPPSNKEDDDKKPAPKSPNASHTRTWDHSRLILSLRVCSYSSFLMRVSPSLVL
jgi:hypothetical protein